jgi:hypothetical protein
MCRKSIQKTFFFQETGVQEAPLHSCTHLKWGKKEIKMKKEGSCPNMKINMHSHGKIKFHKFCQPMERIMNIL